MTSAAVAVTIANWEHAAALAVPGHDRDLRLHHRRQHRASGRRASRSRPSSSSAIVVAVAALARHPLHRAARIATCALEPNGAATSSTRWRRAACASSPTAPTSARWRSTTRKEQQAREDHSLDDGEPLVFLEVAQGDASDFSEDLDVRGVQVGRHRILRCTSPAVPNAIAALLLHIRDRTGTHPPRLLRLDRGQPARLRAALPGPRRGRHRAGDARGPAQGHQEPAGAAAHPRRLAATSRAASAGTPRRCRTRACRVPVWRAATAGR